MRRRWLSTLMLILAWSPAWAHRLDQYLQATTIALGDDEVTLQIHLTPGVAVAPQVLALIGAGGDDTIDAHAQAAYAQRVARDLAVSVDGRTVPLRLTASSFPTVASMRSGLGDIVLSFSTALPAGSAHHLILTNTHLPGIAVYLVNCLVPEDPDIAIVAQQRTVDQSRYQLTFTTGAPPTASRAAPKGPDLRQDHWDIVRSFVQHGIGHILTGYDHLLFACALVLAARTLWDLLKVVTAFTVAHSLTLTLAALNLIRVSPAVVEPLIAASIVFVALQNVLWPRTARGSLRLLAAFAFGLFHGLGFAGGLLTLMQQLPRDLVLLAILGFSIGIEVGQQLVLLPLFGVLSAVHDRTLVQRAGSLAIAVAGVGCLAITIAAVAAP